MTGIWHDQRVRDRAYQLWERAGRPEGRSLDNWLRAEAEITAEERDLEQEIELEREGVV